MKCKFFLEFPASRVFAASRVSAPRGVCAGAVKGGAGDPKEAVEGERGTPAINEK